MLSIFNNKALNQFKNLPKENRIEAFNKVKDMPENVDIRNREDTMISVGLRKRGLNVFDKNKVNVFIQYLKDYLSIDSELRIKKVAVFDTETTDKYNAYAVSLAIIIVNLETLEFEKEYYTLINPKDFIREEAYQVHKISNQDVENQKTFEELLPEIEEIFNEVEMVSGHNVDFDLKVFERELQRINKPNFLANKNVFDTMIMGKEIVKAVDVNGRIKNPRLEEAMEFFNISKPDGEYHNALVDTKACAKVLKQMFLLTPP